MAEEGLLSVEALRPHEVLLQASRQRVKLLDDKHRSIDGIMHDARSLTTTTNRWYYEDHQGMLGPIKRLLQRDLGIAYIDGELLSTTDVAYLNMGLTEQTMANSGLSLRNLGAFIHSTAIDLGRYIRKVLVTLGLDVDSPVQACPRAIPKIVLRDVKSQRYYRSIADEIAPGHQEVSLILTSILSFANMARHIIPIVAGDNSVAAFKMRFLSLYQVTVALEKLLEEDRRTLLFDPQAAGRIRGLGAEESLREISANRSLRNNLVHYRINDTSLRLRAGLPLSGLVEACCSGDSLLDVDAITRSGLDKVTQLLGDLVSPI